MHQAWRQHSTPRAHATPYYVTLRFNEDNQIVTTAPNSAQGVLVYQPTEPSENAGLVGTISFGQANYLHLNIDLLMSEYQTHEPNTGQAADNSPAVENTATELQETLGLLPEKRLHHYLLQETRRVKTNVTHYFDHPAFSVLMHVKRIGN